MTTRPGPSEGWPTYMEDWRATHPLAVIENRLRERARQRARTRLKEAHPEEFDAYYEEELLDVRMEYATVALEGVAKL